MGVSEETRVPPPPFSKRPAPGNDQGRLPPTWVSLVSSVTVVAVTSVLFAAVSPHTVGLPQTFVGLENSVKQGVEVENPPSPCKGEIETSFN